MRQRPPDIVVKADHFVYASDTLFLGGFERRWPGCPSHWPSGIRGLRLVLHRTPRFGDSHRGRGAREDSDVTAFSPSTSTDVLGTSRPLRGSAAHLGPETVVDGLCRGTLPVRLQGPPLLNAPSPAVGHNEGALLPRGCRVQPLPGPQGADAVTRPDWRDVPPILHLDDVFALKF